MAFMQGKGGMKGVGREEGVDGLKAGVAEEVKAGEGDGVRSYRAAVRPPEMSAPSCRMRAVERAL